MRTCNFGRLFSTAVEDSELILTGHGVGNPDTVSLKFASSGYYVGVLDNPQEINPEYTKIATFKDILTVFDDAGIKKEIRGEEINIYVKDGTGDCIIEIVDDATERR